MDGESKVLQEVLADLKSEHLIPKICPKPGLGNYNPSHSLNLAKATVSSLAEHSSRHPTQSCNMCGDRLEN